MGGGLLQIAANSAIDPVFNDPNYTLFLAVYHKYTPFTIQDYTLKLSSLSDFGKKMEVTIPKVGDLLTDMVLTIELPQVSGEYIFTNQEEYLNSITSQFTFSIMNDVQQYNENLYKLSLGNTLQVYLVRDSQIGKYQLVLPLLDATMFLTQGKSQKYDLSSFLASNSQFFDNQYNLHVIKNLNYGLNTNLTNIDYLNYAFQDKEFYFFIANLLNIKQINPSYQITYYNDWINVYYNTVKKYILRRQELVALNTFIENMNQQITNSIQINNYVFNYPSIFSVDPLDNQYDVILPISLDKNYYLTYTPYEAIINNKNYVFDYTSSFFSIFNRRYVLVKRNNNIIGAANINQVLDVSPLRLILRPFRHILKNNLLDNNNFNLFIYYGFDTLQFETKNFAMISSYKLNINKLHEFTLDRAIEINVGSIIIIGINSTELPSNNYNEMYGIFQINQVRKSFSTIDQFTDTGYNTVLSATPIEIDQILSTDTILINSNSSITSTTFYPNYNLSVASNTPSSELISLLKQNIYSDVQISTLITTPINSVSQYLLNQIINTNDFLLTSSIIPVIQKNIETYISDSYNVLFNYIEKIYYKTILKSPTNHDFLNNIYYMLNYQQTNDLFNFIGAGTTTFANLEDGTFRYQTYIKNIINSQISSDGQYSTLLSYTNFLTSYIIQQYQSLSITYTNDWSASLLNVGQNLSDSFVKILNYVQAGNTSGLQTLLTFTTNTFSFTKNDLTNLTMTYNKKDVTPTNISDYYSVTKNIPLNLVVIMNQNSLIIDMTFLILSIQDAFNLQNIDISSIVFKYTTNSSTGSLKIINIGTFLDNYSTNLIPIINNNTNITTQLYGNNILLDYINTQNDTMFGLMTNYEISRQAISRNGGTRYSTYQEDIIDQTPLLEDNTYLINFLSEEYYPRFLYSKQAQLYQNIYQKVNELSQNYDTMSSSIYFMNNINYPRTDGYNYANNNQGSIPYLDPNQFSTILNSTEYAYTLLDKVSVYNILLSPPTFSFMHYLEDLEEHNSSSEQLQYLQTYWNNKFIQSGVNSTTINNYIVAISGKDDALLIYYIYKYLTELLTTWGDMYNLPVNLDQTYFQTIYQLSPQVLGNLLYNTFSFIMQTTDFPNQDSYLSYQRYNSIIQGSQILLDLYQHYNILPQYAIENNTQFNNDKNNLLQEITYVFQVTTRLLKKYKINVVLTSGLQLSNYPIVNTIHGSGKLTKIILVSDQYTINNSNSNFNSSIAFPTGYYVADYYKLFNLSIHYDYQKYIFFSGYGGILRDTQYPDKTIASFYKKINNYLTASVDNLDFAFFYAFQTGSYLPNMEGHIIQSYQAWIQRSAQPYFYYYNLLSQFYDMMYIYSGRSFVSEYYTNNTTNNTTSYNNRHDIIQGATIYATRMAYGTRDNVGRLNGVSMRYNLLDQRLVGIDVNLIQSNINSYDTTQDPIQILNMLNILNQRFTDYQEFLVLIKNSQNIIDPYPTSDIYSTLLTEFKVNSVSMFDLDIFNNWNSFILNYYTTYNYNFSSIITGLSTTINLYNTMASNTLDMSSLGYELYHFTNNFNTINQRNFADTNALRYENGTIYHHIIDDLITSLSGSTYFLDRDSFNNDVLYWNTNYSLVTLDFLDTTLQKIMGPYQSDVSVFKQLFTSILNYRQKNVSTSNQTATQIQLYNDYYSINDVTSLTFYDKFYKFNSSLDYNLIPLIYHDLYNIQNASHTVVFYLNYLYSFLNNTSSKPNISAFDDPNLPVSYYFPKYLSSGIDYFLANFHQLRISSLAFYPYKSVPANVTLYNGNIVARPKSFMYLFLLLKIQYRNYYYNSVDNAYTYITTTDYNNNPVRKVIGLNTYPLYPDITNDVAAFDNIIDSLSVRGTIDHLQNVTHAFFINKHVDNLLFIKDLLNDLISVPDNASINTILTSNDNYIEFLSERTIVTNAFDNTGLIFGQYPYTLGVLSNYNTMGSISMIDSTGDTVSVYIEGNIVLPSLIAQIYYFLVSECFILNQTELIGSSFQNTPMSLGNILAQITAKDWKSGLINLISEYLFLILKSKKILYQNSIYEISFNDIYNRLKVNTNNDTINDFLDMFINSLLTVTITSTEVVNNDTTTIQQSLLGEYEQFKIPSIFSLINIKQNYNYSQYYRLMFALRQSIIGTYNNFQERVQFHNSYDYWKVNNTILISDYTTINFNNVNYMVRKSESDDVLAGLNYYSQNRAGIPTNLFTCIIDYIITNVQNGIVGSQANKYTFENFVYVKNGYNVTLTLFNVFFTNNQELYNIVIDTGSKTIQAVVVTGNIQPFTISYNSLPFGYQYDFVNNALFYQQLLYQYDIVDVLENMFIIFKDIQNFTQALTLLVETYSTPYVPGPGVINTSDFNFIYFPTFIESFIYYDFTSATNPALSVNAVLLPLTAPLGTATLFNVILSNWSQFYGKFFYIYDTYSPTSANYLGTGTAIFTNGIYTGSLYITFNVSGKRYLSLTNALIDDAHPFGSSGVAVNVVSPITISSISDGSIDNYYAIRTIPRSFLITLDKWDPKIGITELYTFFSTTPDGNNLTNANGDVGLADGPFTIETYLIPGDTDILYRINAIVTFPIVESIFVYVCDKNNINELNNAQVFALIPNITKAQSINVVSDIDPNSTIGQLDSYTGIMTMPKTYTLSLNYWSPQYNINQLYVYFADNVLGQNLGNDIGIINQPQVQATIIKVGFDYQLTFTAGFKNLGNNYVYLTYYPISNQEPYGTYPVSFLTNPTNPIITTNITGVTGILNQYISIVNQPTLFTVTLGNWFQSYIDMGVTQLYIYTKNITDPDIYTSYIPINNLPDQTYQINLVDGQYQLSFVANFSNIYQLYVYLTYNQISSIYNYGEGLVNIQITNPPGDLVNFNYIDVIYPFSTDFINNILYTFTTNALQLHVNNYSPNYNIYQPVSNQLYIFYATENDPTTIYSPGEPLIFDENSNINFDLYTQSINPVYIFVSNNSVYGNGLISYSAGPLNNIIGQVNSILTMPTFVINNKSREFLITLPNWDASYATVGNITSLDVFIGPNIDTTQLDFGSFPITQPDNYVVDFNYTVNTTPNTYNVFIYNTPYLSQSVTNQLLVSDQIYISTLIPDTVPVLTFTQVTYTGTIANWNVLFPTQLNLFIAQTIDNTTPVNSIIDIDSLGNFTLTTQVSQYPFTNFALSDASVYGTGYLETIYFEIATVIGPVNARFNLQNYVLTNKPTNYSILLQNWDATYPINNLYVYIVDINNNLLWNYGAESVTFVVENTNYYLLFSATITASLDTGNYTVYISDTDYNIPGFLISEPLTNQLYIILQISLDHIDISPLPFATYTSTLFTGYINNWLGGVYPTQMYFDYIEIFNNTSQSVLVNVDNNGIFTYTGSINTLPGIIVSISDNPTYGNGYIETQQLTLNTIIGPINSVLTTTPYALFGLNTNFNINLTNWNTSYAIANLYIYISTALEPSSGTDPNLVYTFSSQEIQFDGTNYYINFMSNIPDNIGIVPGLYNLYLSDQDPTNILTTPLVNQLINTFNIGTQISIDSITTTPNPFVTYTSTLFSGQLNNWRDGIYPSTLNLFYTTIFDNNITVAPIVINADGTFSYTNEDLTLPGVTISLSDASTYGTGYLESNVFTLNAIIGPVNSILNTTPYAIYNLTTNFDITLSQWNASYPGNMYIYLADVNNTVIYSFGAFPTSTLDNINYSLIFTSSIPDTVVSGSYNLYMSEQDPTNIVPPSIINQFINIFNVGPQIVITNIMTDPAPFQTFVLTVFNGQLSNWVNGIYPGILNLFYTSVTIPPTPPTIVPTTINSDGTFTYTNTATSDITISLSDASTYDTGYIKSNEYLLSITIAPIDATITQAYAIYNLLTNYNITLTHWSANYNINNLYIYIGSDISTVIYSFGSQVINYDGINYTMSFTNTFVPTDVPQGIYNIYLSNEDPTTTNPPLINQLIAAYSVADQTSISSITTTPTPFETYTSTLFSGSINNWINAFYPTTLNLFYTPITTPSTEPTMVSVTINSDGTFSYTDIDNTLPGITISLSDSITYGSGYIESNSYEVDANIGPVNATLSTPSIIQNKTYPDVIILTNWNSTYPITNLFIYIGSDPNTPIEYYGNNPIIYLDPVDSLYKMAFNITPVTAPGTYTMYISDTDPAISGTFAIRQAITTSFTILNQIQITITPSVPFVTYNSTLFNGTVTNWVPQFDTIATYITYYSSYDSIYYNELITIIDDGTGTNTGTFSFTYTEDYTANFNMYVTDNTTIPLTYGNGYIESQIYTLTPTIGYTNTVFDNQFVIQNISSTLSFTINNWNLSYSPTSLYIYVGSDINTPIESFGSQTIINTGGVFSISFTATITLDLGLYTLYLCDADPTQDPFPTFTVQDTINNQLNVINQISISSLTTTPSPVPTYTSTIYDGTIANWLPTTFLSRLYIFIAPIIDNTIVPLDFIVINNDGTFTYTTSTSINFNTDNIALGDNTVYTNSYLQTPLFEFATIIGNINGNITPITYNKDVEISYTITLTNWNSSYNINTLYIFSATDTNFTNLTPITSESVVFNNDIYTVTFNQTFNDQQTYYFVVSDVADPVNTPYNVYQTINVPIYYFNTNYIPLVLQTPVILSKPSDVTNLFMWFDANAVNYTYLNQPTNNSSLSTLTNNTGMAIYNLSTVNGSANFITDGISHLNSINLSNTGLTASVPAGSFDNGLSVFIVFKNSGSTTPTTSLFYRNITPDDFPYPINVYNASRDIGDDTGQNIQTITSPFDISTSTTSTIFYFNTDSTLQYNEYSNGTLNTSTTTDYYNDLGTKLSIGINGANNTTDFGFNGDISEILIYNRTLTSTEQQTIEGYLAWKWDLVTDLPVEHPYSYLNPSFTVPVNTYIGITTSYEILLKDYTSIPSITSYTIQYNTDYSETPTGLTVIANVPITQDENNNYILVFPVQFPSANTYYMYLTDSNNNVYKSISTPIIVTNGSSLITLSTNTYTVDQNTILIINLNGWSSLFGLTNVDIYYSFTENDPNPIFITNTNIQYTFNDYFVSFLVTQPSGNFFYYVIGSKNSIITNNNSINITVNVANILTPCLSVYSNYILDPTLIPGLTLWLDANTINGSYVNQPNNTANVLTWVDKSSNNYSVTATGTPTFASNGINDLPSVQLSTGNNFIANIPTGTFTDGLTAFVVYQSNGTSATYESLISRVNTNTADPYDMFNTSRIIGDGTNTTTLTSSITINNNTVASIFYANMNSTNLSYFESNNFTQVINEVFTNWDDTNNSGILNIGSRADGNSNFNGYISEILIFNQPLTKIQKYQIEGYLAYKWNMEIYLPLYHPFSSYTPSIFTPLLFDTLQLWMDASNTSSYTLDNDNVTQWNDLSYNKNILTTNTSFNTISIGSRYGKSTLVFNSSVMNFNNSTLLLNTNDATLMFLIYIPTSTTSSSPFTNISSEDLFPYSDGNIYTSFGLESNTNIGTLPTGWVIYTVVASSYTNTTKFYINGTNIYTGTYSSTYYNNQTGWTIGATTTPMNATLAEMMVFNSALSPNKRILLEGYLANKWSVTNLLPIGNQYKTTSPTMTDYNNLLNEGLQLNLDSSNTNNFTFSGSNILTWSDLSSTYGNPILQTNPANNLTGVYFNYNSMEPTTIENYVLDNVTGFSIFTVGYINNTNTNTNPTILGSDNYTTYQFNIRQNTNFVDQISISNNELSAQLSSKLSNGIQNMNGDSNKLYASTFINGRNIVTNNEMILNNRYTTNFYLGGISSDTNSFLENSYIHKVLVYNINLDDVSRYIIEGQLATTWNVPTTNGLPNINTLNTYMGINTLFTILLENWSLTSITTVYIGYNTDPNNLTNLNVIGSFPVVQLNNTYYVQFNTVFSDANTYYFHIVDDTNVEYASISKQIITKDLSTVISTLSNITLSEGTPYNLQLINWKNIVSIIGLYSDQITNFNLSLGQSMSDPSPVFITNLQIQYNAGQYYLQIPGLLGANGLYLYLSTVMNSITINITPIAITMSGSITLSIDRNYGILNTNETYTLTINTNIPDIYTIVPTVYIYYGLMPDETTPDGLIGSGSVNSSNQVTFSYTSTYSQLYFYISSSPNYLGLTAFTGPVNFINSNSLSFSLDNYDTNTNTRKVLLGGWSNLLSEITDLSILSGTQSNYTSQTLIDTLPIVTFTPTSISGLKLWLDGSNINNFIINNNVIEQWNDTSGNSNNAVNPDTLYPSYDTTNKGVSFTGGNYLYLPDGTIPTGDNNYHIFVVLTPSNSTSGPQFILGAIDDINNPGTNNLNTFWTISNAYDQSWNNNNDLISNNYVPNTKQIVSFEYINGINRSTYMNGVTIANDFPDARNSTSNNNLIGGILQNNTFTNLVHEIIIYNNPLSNIERQQIENYLSYKWAVVVNVNLLDIPNLNVWYDAMDPSNVVYDQNSLLISQINDKSGNNNVCVQSNGGYQPTFKNNMFNFNGSQFMTSDGSINLNSYTMFIVCAQNSSYISSEGIIVGQTNNNDYQEADSFAFIGGDNASYEYAYISNGSQIANISYNSLPMPLAIYEIEVNENIGNMWVNGNIINQNISFSTSNASPGFALGCRWTNGIPDLSQGLHGNINEVIIYNRNLSSNERIEVENYLSKKWDIPFVNYNMTKPRNWYNIVSDGNDGEAGRVRSTLGNFVSTNTSNSNTKISTIYYDTENSQIRQAYGREPDMLFQDLQNISGLTGMVASASVTNISDYIIFSTTSTDLYCLATNQGVNTNISLSSINSTVTNVKLRKFITNSLSLFIISVGNGIYQIIPDNSTTSILVNQLVSDYDGTDFYCAIDETNSLVYLTYSQGTNITIVNFPYNSTTITTIASLPNTISQFAQPRIVYTNKIIFFVTDTLNSNMINSTVIDLGAQTITINSTLVSCNEYKPYIVNNRLYILYTDLTNHISQIQIIIMGINYNMVTNNLNTTNTVYQNTFDVTSINDEQYIYYIDNNQVLRELWNPINSINIKINDVVTNIQGVINSTSSSIYPSFNINILDYGLLTNEVNNKITYVITINNKITITDMAYPNQSICITDINNNNYYIKLLPNTTIYSTGSTKYANYVPGYYLNADTFGQGSCYYTIYSSDGVPIWYRRNNSDPNYSGNPLVCSLFLGNDTNLVITNIFDGSRPRTVVNVATLEEKNYRMLPSTRSGQTNWDVHEALQIKTPGRVGNMIYMSYINGFYIQEQSSTSQEIVWEFYSSDFFTSTDPEFFHINAIDVHPITGDLLCSFRNCSSLVCINYITKNVDWAIDSVGSLIGQCITPSLTKFLTPLNEPIIDTVQYNGTSAQHDCRWHPELTPLTSGNNIISAFDNQSFNGRPAARSVVYEIDLTNNSAIWRGNVYSYYGTSGYMGSYKIITEANNTTSHVVDWVQQHPCLIEYAGNQYGMPTQTELFRMDFSGDQYRISKATPSDLNINSMRLTSGMPYSTI